MKKLSPVAIILANLLLLLFARQPAAAYYDSSLQRWLNRDPVLDLGFIIHSRKFVRGELGANSYLFVRNKPTRHLDPDGLTIYSCTVPTSSFPTLGIGRHAYLWDDRPHTPDTERECGQEKSCDSGPHSTGNHGPIAGDSSGLPSGTICIPVEGSEFYEDFIMHDCREFANSGIWIPGLNDCHNKRDRCLSRNGFAPPENPRFTPIPNDPVDPGYRHAIGGPRW